MSQFMRVKAMCATSRTVSSDQAALPEFLFLPPTNSKVGMMIIHEEGTLEDGEARYKRNLSVCFTLCTKAAQDPGKPNSTVLGREID